MRTREIDPRQIASRFRMQGDINKAKELADQLIDQGDLSPFDLATVALAYLESGVNDKAFHHATELLARVKTMPENDEFAELSATARCVLGTIHRERNELNYAFYHLNMGLFEKSPTWLESYILRNLDLERNELNHAFYHLNMGLFEKSPAWLESYILRNLGLTHLKDGNYKKAAATFLDAIELTMQNPNAELDGSLPALTNYYGLSLVRHSLKNNKSPDAGLAVLRDATIQFQRTFTRLGISALQQQTSHDWQSHLFHRGLVACEIAESEPNLSKATSYFAEAADLLTDALAGRIANKANQARLADACMWLGRAYTGLGLTVLAKNCFQNALQHYQNHFQQDPNAPQISEASMRLNNIKSSYPTTLKLFGVRPEKATGPRVACALARIQNRDGVYAASHTASQFIFWARKQQRHFNLDAIKPYVPANHVNGMRK